MPRSRLAGIACLLLTAPLVAAEPPSPEAVRAWVAQLGAAEFSRREEASRALLEAGGDHPEAVLPILPVEDPDPEVRQRCEALRRLIPWEPSRRRLDALLKGCDPKAAPLLESLRDAPEPKIVDRFASLKEGGDCRAEVMACLVTHEDERVRASALNGLVRLGARERAGTALAALSDPSPAVRLAAITAVGRLKPSGGGATLAALLSDEDGHLRAAVLNALGETGDASQAPIILPLLRDPALPARRAAGQALARLGAPGLLAELVALAGAEDLTVRAAAVTALGGIKDPEVARRLLALLEDPSEEVSQAAVGALQQHGSSDLKSSLLPLLARPESQVRYNALVVLYRIPRDVETALAIVPLVGDPEPRVAQMACRDIANLGLHEVAPALLDLLAREETLTRVLALQALKGNARKADVARIAAFLEDPDAKLSHGAAALISQLAAESWPAKTPPTPQAAKAWWAERRALPEWGGGP